MGRGQGTMVKVDIKIPSQLMAGTDWVETSTPSSQSFKLPNRVDDIERCVIIKRINNLKGGKN